MTFYITKGHNVVVTRSFIKKTLRSFENRVLKGNFSQRERKRQEDGEGCTTIIL
jgi:hypothetical protein